MSSVAFRFSRSAARASLCGTGALLAEIPSSLFLLLRSFKHQPPTAPIPDPSKTLSPASSFVEPDTRLAGETRATENRRMLARDRATLPEIRAPPHRIINNLRRFIVI